MPVKKDRTVEKLDDQPVVPVPGRNRDRRHSDPQPVAPVAAVSKQK